jgi:putative oxidoreductase
MENEGARVGVAHFTHNTLRIVVGFLLWFHGLQKLFGAFGWGEPVELMSRMGLAGVLEAVGGPLIMLGLFTRPVAFLLAGEMAFVYFIAHYPQGFWPIETGGELPALYCWAFLFFAANGAGAFSLDGLIRARRRSRAAG